MSFDRNFYQSQLFNLADDRELLDSPLYVFDSIASTNQKLWELIDRGVKPTIAAIALQQSAGRGQWGKQWQSQLGGLYLSVALNTNLKLQDGFYLTLATAVGIANILRDRDVPVLLKWSNDLILQGKKLGGIKTETRTQQEYIKQAVIGVGINWTNPIPEVGISLRSFLDKRKEKASNVVTKQHNNSVPYSLFPVSSLSIQSLEELAALTTYGIISGYDNYLALGIDRLLSEYLKLLVNLGQTVRVNGCSGTIVGVSPTGELKVRLRSPGASSEISLPPGQISLGYDLNSIE
jgi:BirA family transcriptional regulator, biotin operon repressor / biotin---[acetyl-CoA-carboxylase] ligase